MMRLLQSSAIAIAIGCLLYLGVTVALIKPGQLKIVQAQQPAEEPPLHSGADDPSWMFRNPDLDQWMEEMKREKEALALREQQLQELQARLEAERQELNVVTQKVHQLQAEFDRNVVRIKEQEFENLKRQARIMAGMTPEGAAGLLNAMTEDDAVRILFTMKPDEASPVLEAISKMGPAEAKRAATITERMRRALPPEPPPAKTL